jgi:O-antigen/teichoic acid export membrane protein
LPHSPKNTFAKYETLIVMGGQFVQLVLTFATSLMIARILNADGYGVVNLLRTLFVTILTLAPLGLDLALLKYCGHEKADNPLVYQTIRKLRQFILGLSLCIIVLSLIAVYLTPLGKIYQFKDFDYLFFVSIIALPFAVDGAILGAVYKARGQAAYYSLLTHYLQPITRVVLVTAAMFLMPTVEAIVWVTTIQLVLSGSILFFHHTNLNKHANLNKKPTDLAASQLVQKQTKSILSMSVWMCLSLFAYGLMRSADLMFLGAFVDAKNLGEYAALATVAQLIQFYPVAASQSLGPQISKEFHDGNLKNIQSILLNYTQRAAIISGFVFGGIAIFSERLDLVLGSSFHFNPLICALIAFGQLISATLAPTGFSLSMTGKHKQENTIILAGCIVLIILLFALVPKHGQIGAALAAAIAVTLLNIARFSYIAKHYKFFPAQLRSILPPIVALLLAWFFHNYDYILGGRTLLITFISCTLYTITYTALSYVWFLPEDWKQKINQIMRRAA